MEEIEESDHNIVGAMFALICVIWCMSRIAIWLKNKNKNSRNI